MIIIGGGPGYAVLFCLTAFIIFISTLIKDAKKKKKRKLYLQKIEKEREETLRRYLKLSDLNDEIDRIELLNSNPSDTSNQP